MNRYFTFAVYCFAGQKLCLIALTKSDSSYYEL